MIASWVLDQNLRAFLEAVSVFAEYDFDDDDWTAIHHGLLARDPGSVPEVVLEYPLEGRRHVALELKHEPGSGVVTFRIEADEDLETRTDAIAFVAATFLLD